MAIHQRGYQVNATSKHPTLGARLFLAGLGLTLAVIGGLFVWLMARSYLRAREMRHWPEVQCTIISSELQERRHDSESPAEFRHGVSFGYNYQDQTFTSDRLTLRGSPWSSRRADVENRASKFTVGSTRICRVDPTNPDQAILELDSMAPGYSIWFPALFVVGGLGIAGRALIEKRPKPLHPAS
jgi:hypothetical protein